MKAKTNANTNLSEVKHFTYLGVEVSSDLSCGIHINNTVGKANRFLNILKINVHDCLRNIKETAYTAYVGPVAECASAVWDPYQQCDIYNLEQGPGLSGCNIHLINDQCLKQY